MYGFKGHHLPAALCGLLVITFAAVAFGQALPTTVQGKQGGVIAYGLVNGATTPGAAMTTILRNVQNACGEKPQVGRLFRVKGSNSDAVFFTVTNRPQGNLPVAGMLIAAPTGPKTVEAATVMDVAAHFGSSINPMLQQLFSAWHPAGAGSPAGRGSAPAAAGGRNVALPPMQQVSLPDGTAAFRLPAGWNVGPRSGAGSAAINGPQGESLALMFYVQAIDPRGQTYQKDMQMRFRPPHTVFLPSNLDVAKNYVALWQAIRASAGLGPAPMTVDKVDQVPGQQGQCVVATGQINPDGRGMKEMWTMLCRTPVDRWGDYGFTTSQYQLPLGASDQQRATAMAIVSSYQVNEQRVQAMSNAQLAPMMAQFQQHQQALMSFTQAQIAHTREIGAEATQRYNDADRARVQSSQDFNAREDNISRQGQGFSNYILDQTVVQNNNVAGTGMVGHATLWNSTADALVKADPNKYEYVPERGYWPGTDFHP
jgi:hypothetical protein